jgi:uncharacterized protein (TIGR02001 family)
MRIILGCLSSVIALAAATPALADEAPAATPAITINGTATIVSDYRFRGISQTDKNFAVQGSLTVSHESGFYVSVWGSSVNGYVVAATNGASQEIDIIGGWKKTFGGTTVDIGALYYFYPKTKAVGDLTSSDFIEPYLAVSHTFGPVTAKGTVNWAPKQKALSLNQIGPAKSNVYLAGDLSAAIPGTPLSLSAHLGHSFGPSWLASDTFGKNEYTDWGLGASVTYKAITLGVQYVDTDARFIAPSGSNAAKGGIVGSIGVSF